MRVPSPLVGLLGERERPDGNSWGMIQLDDSSGKAAVSNL